MTMNVISTILWNGKVLTLNEHEDGALVLEGQYGDIGKLSQQTLFIQNVAENEKENGDGREIQQISDDIRQGKILKDEMKEEAWKQLKEEVISIRNRAKSIIKYPGDDPFDPYIRNAALDMLRNWLRENRKSIEELSYEESSFWAYATGEGVFFGLDLPEKRLEMKSDAIVALKKVL